MFWWYALIEKNEKSIVYAYSCDNKDLDGRIVYSYISQKAAIDVPSESDLNSKKLMHRSLIHFNKVIEEGFPEEVHVCCG